MAQPTLHGIARIHAAGDHGILVELDSAAAVLSLQQQLAAAPMAGQLDVVPAARTVLITTSIPGQTGRMAAHVRGLDLSTVPTTRSTLQIIDTVYDGADLDAVAEATGLSREAVIASHTGQVWTAAFLGFAPGFAYLTGEKNSLDVPRRSSPRTSVPTGSVALAGGYSAVYPRSSPGGWQLIGHTAARLWDLDRESPALIRAGDTVRFRPVRDVAVRAVAPGSTTTDGPTTTAPAPKGAPTPEAVGAGTAAAATAPEKTAPAKTPTPGLLVLDAGLQATIQDLGRPGFADLGVTASGALDQRALRRANRLAGNPPEAAGLELLAGGFRIQALQDQVLAVTGAVVPLQITAPAPTAASATRAGARTAASATRSAARPRKAPLNAPFALLAGETLTWEAPTAGLRSYLAVRGGLDVAPVLGSRATDTLSGIGPPPLQRDTTLAVLAARAGSVVGRPEPAAEPPTGVQVLRLVPGPRADWFSPEAVEQFCSQEWTVSQQSNRIGLRLSGNPVQRSRTGELASEGTVQGAVQIPSGGQPVLFLADHPVTGGYPVIGVVAAADLDLAAQLAPGTLVRFQVVADRPDLSQRSSMPDPGRAPSPHRPEPSPKQGNTHA